MCLLIVLRVKLHVSMRVCILCVAQPYVSSNSTCTYVSCVFREGRHLVVTLRMMAMMQREATLLTTAMHPGNSRVKYRYHPYSYYHRVKMHTFSV